MRNSRILLAALVLLMAVPVLAQVPTGSISGTVLDPTGAAIPGAEVNVVNEGTGAVHKITTSSLGAYFVSTLPVGLYRVEVISDGFRKAVVSGIKISAGSRTSMSPIRLEIGTVAETVTVEAAAEIVQTSSATVSTTITDVNKLPIPNRAPISLVGFQATVSQNGRSNTAISGLRSSSINMTLEGINIQDNFIRSSAIFTPNLLLLSQVSEFTLTSSNSGTSSGVGATQISFVTPSGTNDWHGEGFWQHRNDAIAANEWFNNADGVEIPKLIQNQGGGNAGGPIIKDKLFIYGYYELFRLSAQDSQNEVVLTPNARNGIFSYIDDSDVLQQIDIFAIASANLGAPVTADAFMASLLSMVPTNFNNFSVGDSSASQLLNTAGFRFNQDAGRTRDNWGFKTDFNPSTKHSVSVTYQWNRDILPRSDIDNTFNPSPTTANDDEANFLSAAYRWSPSGSFTNEFRVGFNLAPASFTNSEEPNFGNFVICGGGPFGCGGGDPLFTNPISDFRSQGRDTDTYASQYNGSYVRGNHSMTFGWQSQFVRTAPFTCFDCPATFFLGISTANGAGLASGDFPGIASGTEQSRANRLLASLAGFVEDGTLEFNVTSRTSGFVPGAANRRNYELNNHSFYLHDAWRVSQNFTLNLGLRFEYMGQLCEQNGLHLQHQRSAETEDAAFAQLADPNTTLDFAGLCGSGPQFYDKDLNNWAPQVGFAWDPWGDGKTSFRGGYSFHYFNDEAIKAPVNALRGSSAGLAASSDVLNLTNTISGGLPSFTTPTFMVPRTLQDNVNDFGSGFAPQTSFTVNPELRTPYVQEWSFGIQRDLGWNTVVDVGYRGNRSTLLTRAIDINQVDIISNGFLADFNRARQNAFICEAAGMGFNGACTLPGSQPLTVFPNMVAGGLLGNVGTIQDRIRKNEPGDLAAVYHFNGLAGTVPFVVNPLAAVADMLTNVGFSTYHAGVVEVRHRASSGLFFLANYTWSKALSDSAGLGGQGQNNFDPRLDNARPELDKARAIFDLKHAFKGLFIYELPMGSGHGLSSASSAVNKLLGGWSVSSTFTWQTGAPFSILSNRGTFNRRGRSTNKNTAFATGDAGSIVGLNVTPDGVFIINPSALDSDGDGVNDDSAAGCVPFGSAGLCNPGSGGLGNLSRRAFSGPDFFDWDFSIAKNTHITERTAVEFRVHFLNFLNHPTFLSENQNINSTSFGVMDETLSDSRVIQFALKVTF